MNIYKSQQKLVTTSDVKEQSALVQIYAKKGETWIEDEGLKQAVILFILEGSILISYEESGHQVVKAGEMFLLPPMCAHSVQTLEDAFIVNCLFHTDQPLCTIYRIEDLIPFLSEVEDVYMRYGIRDPINCYLRSVVDYLSMGIDNYHFFQCKKHELFHLFPLCYSKKEIASFLYPILVEDAEFRTFVEQNFLLIKNVPELAALANYSTSGFIKKFQRYFNESPYRWIQRKKASRILQDLVNSGKSLKEIAFDYQFSSYQHFFDFCKTQYGKSPTQARQELQVKKLEIVSNG